MMVKKSNWVGEDDGLK